MFYGPRGATPSRGVLVLTLDRRIGKRLAEGLWDLHYKTVWQRSPADALRFAREHDVRFFIVDADIEDAETLIEEFRRARPAARILAFSRYRETDSARAVLAAEGVATIEPDVAIDELDAILKQTAAGNGQAGDRATIERVLADCGGNRTEAARRLGISRTQLWRVLKTPPDGS